MIHPSEPLFIPCKKHGHFTFSDNRCSSMNLSVLPGSVPGALCVFNRKVIMFQSSVLFAGKAPEGLESFSSQQEQPSPFLSPCLLCFGALLLM